MFNVPPNCTQAFLREIHPELSRDYEEELENESPECVECPYCHGVGSQAWFENHEHVNPFGDELAK